MHNSEDEQVCSKPVGLLKKIVYVRNCQLFVVEHALSLILYSNPLSFLFSSMGGILPTVARDWHEGNIENVVDTACQNAGLTVHDIDAIAVTTKPGSFNRDLGFL